MTEPGICPSCGSDRVQVIDTRRMSEDSTYRRRSCRECGYRYSRTGCTYLTDDGAEVTIEGTSLQHVRRVWQRMKVALNHKF